VGTTVSFAIRIHEVLFPLHAPRDKPNLDRQISSLANSRSHLFLNTDRPYETMLQAFHGPNGG